LKLSEKRSFLACKEHLTQRCGGPVRITKEPEVTPKIGHNILYSSNSRVEPISNFIAHLRITRIRLLVGLGAYQVAELMKGRIDELLTKLNHAPDAACNSKFKLHANVIDVHCEDDLQRLMRFADVRLLDMHRDLIEKQTGNPQAQESSLQLTQPWSIHFEVFLICQKAPFPKASNWIKGIGHSQLSKHNFPGSTKELLSEKGLL
jgi:hypothetical protein